MRGLLLLALMLAGCAASPPLERGTPMVLSPEQTSAVHDGVRKALKDPDSARFGLVSAGRLASGGIVACGWINAKNSFGGYTGEKPFGGILLDHTDPATKKSVRSFTVTGLGGDAAADYAVDSVCKQSGVALP